MVAFAKASATEGGSMPQVAHPCRKRDWEPEKRLAPDYYFDALAPAERDAVEKIFPHRSSWSFSDYEDVHRQKMDIPPAILDEVMFAQNQGPFNEIIVLETDKADATAFIGLHGGQWYPVAAFGEKEYFEKVKEEAKKPQSNMGGFLLAVSIAAAIVIAGLIISNVEELLPFGSVNNSNQPVEIGAPNNQLVTQEKSQAGTETPWPPPNSKFFVWNPLTNERITLQERFPDLESLQLVDQRTKVGRMAVWLRCRLKNGDIYETIVQAWEFRDDKETHFKIIDLWRKIEFF